MQAMGLAGNAHNRSSVNNTKVENTMLLRHLNNSQNNTPLIPFINALPCLLQKFTNLTSVFLILSAMKLTSFSN
jgi:hypothetical protein